jgi:hypothetical protein
MKDSFSMLWHQHNTITTGHKSVVQILSFSAVSPFSGLSWTVSSKMASKASNILEYVVGLVWNCLILMPAALKNPVFAMLLATEDVLQLLLSDSLLVFAPGLLDVVQATTPPSISYFKSQPTYIKSVRQSIFLCSRNRAVGPKST